MSDLKDRLDKDFKSALKSRDTVRKNVVQLVRAAILQKEKDEQIDALDEADILKIIEKAIKERKELIDSLDGQRQDVIEQKEEEIEILSDYLPKQLTDEELDELVQEVIAQEDATSMKDMGKVMGILTKKTAGRADGARISEVVKSYLA